MMEGKRQRQSPWRQRWMCERDGPADGEGRRIILLHQRETDRPDADRRP